MVRCGSLTPNYSAHPWRPLRDARIAELPGEAAIGCGAWFGVPPLSSQSKSRAANGLHHWLWMASSSLQGYRSRVIYEAGHRRWGIENKAFNELTQFYALEHCYHHQAGAMLAQMLILMLGFVLFNAYALLHSQRGRWGRVSLKELAQELNLALEEPLQREVWFDSS